MSFTKQYFFDSEHNDEMEMEWGVTNMILGSTLHDMAFGFSRKGIKAKTMRNCL
jgi:hypothetical protein